MDFFKVNFWALILMSFVIWFVNIFSHCVTSPFIVLKEFIAEQKVFNFDKVQFTDFFSFVDHPLVS